MLFAYERPLRATSGRSRYAPYAEIDRVRPNEVRTDGASLISLSSSAHRTAASTIRVLNLFQSHRIDASRRYKKFSSRLARDCADGVDTSSIHLENISLRSSTRVWSEAAWPMSDWKPRTAAQF